MLWFTEDLSFPEVCNDYFLLRSWGLKPFIGYGRKFEPGEKVPFHLHGMDWHLIYIVSGEIIQSVNGKKVTLREGDISYMGRGCLHGLEVPKNTYCECLNIKLFDVDDSHSLQFPRWKGITKDKGRELKPIINEILEELAIGRGRGSKELITAKLSELLVKAFRSFEEDIQELGYQDVPDSFCTRNELLVQKAKHFMEKNYNKALSLDEIANEVYLSPKYFCALFKDITGKGPYEYLTEIKIQKAENFLQLENYSIREVAKSVGYDDSSYFTQVFKKYKGLTPSEYRRMIV